MFTNKQTIIVAGFNLNLNYATSPHKKNHATSPLREYPPYNNWDMLTAQASGTN